MAGITHLKEFQEPSLRGVVDATLQEAEVTLADRYLPNGQTFSTTFAYDIIKNNKYIGAMIGHGAEAPVVDRDAVAKMHGEIAKFGLKYIATEEELLALHQGRQGEQSAMVERLVFKGASLVQALNRRIGVIKAEALFKGSFSYNKNGVKVTVSFGVDAPVQKDWNTDTTDVIGDLLDLVEAYEAKTGQTPSTILMSREAQAKLLRNKVVITEAGRPDGSTRVSQAELNSVLGGFGIPAIQIVTDRKITVKDVYTGEDEVIEFFPVNRVVLISEGVGEFLIGPTVESNFEPRLALSAKDKDEPIESIIKAVGAGFPAIERPDLVMHADVFTV